MACSMKKPLKSSFEKGFGMIKGLLIDLDGTVYNDSIAIPGAIAALQKVRRSRLPMRFITNTTMKSRETLRQKLASMGFDAAREEIFSAAYAGAMYVRQQVGATCHAMLLDDAKKDYWGLESAAERVDFVVVGDLGDQITFEKLNRAFLYLFHGAKLIALQKNRFWLSDKGFQLDAGAFVALLEYAANTEAILIGKPAAPFFEMALHDLNLPRELVLMVGDDVESDIVGAHRIGMQTALVRTGKFREEDLQKSTIQPDHVLHSIAELEKIL